MKRVHFWVLALFLLGLPLPLACQSIVDAHGPDGLAFTGDDPLRVGAGVHNGAFFVSTNAMDEIRPEDPPDDAELLFLNFSDMTISRLKFLQKTAWEKPAVSVTDKMSGLFASNVDHSFYPSGCAFLHQIWPAGGSRDNFAVRIDPASFGPGAAMFAMIKEIRLEGVSLDTGQACTSIDLEGGDELLVGRFDIRMGNVHVRIQVLGLDVWVKLTGSSAPVGSGGTATVSDLDPQVKTEIETRLGLLDPKPSITVAGIVAAANRNASESDCANLDPRPSQDQCNTINELIDAARSNLNAGKMDPGLVQAVIDAMTKRGTVWLGWWDPYNNPASKDLIGNVVKNKIRAEMMKYLYGVPAQQEPVYSGAYLFDTLYLYGPKGLWLVNTNGEDGLAERYGYARLCRLDPSKVYTDGEGRPCLASQVLDVITGKPGGRADPLPWPPGTGSLMEEHRLKSRTAWSGGACQVVGDCSAIGVEGATPDMPNAFARLTIAVNPKSDSMDLAMTYRVGEKGNLDVNELTWSQGPKGGQYDLPPNYQASPQNTRFFSVGLANRVEKEAGLPRADIQNIGRKLLYRWDYDGNGTIDSNFGRSLRFVSNIGSTAVCYIADIDTKETGVGMTATR